MDNKLFAIEITFEEEAIYKDLEAKYGGMPSEFITIGEGYHEIKAWFNNKGRIITYDKNYGSPFKEETVGYIDSSVYNKAADQLKKERALELKATRKKID